MSHALSSPRFERVDLTKIDSFGTDASRHGLFQSGAWLAFLAEVQNAEPVAAILTDGSQDLGRFAGLIVRRWGFRFLGSPLPGWTTPYMGFDLRPGVPRRLAATALVDFAFRELRCAHLELRDRWLGENDVDELGFGRRRDVGYDDRTFEIDLRRSEDELFGRMESACRRCIRQADKRGLVVEEATEISFADEFYAQLSEVFLRQGLVPTYGVERVRALIRHLQPAGQLLLLRARDAEGRGIATGIYPAFGETALFWGGASLRAHQHNRPNEALHWYAMRYWKRRGVIRYDLGGFMEYKRKYGGDEVTIPGFRLSRSPIISALRTLAPRGMRTKQLVVGRLRQRQLLAPSESPVAAAGD
ncbi:MAG TPA: GNAT family N-acetyltransferase [Thermomicrobiales bacterium]